VGKVLIADDNRAVQSALELMLSLHDLQTICASSPADAIACVEREPIDLVIQDMNFAADTTSGDEGVALFRELRARDPDLPIILLTAWTHLETAIELVKSGAADYLSKPWDDDKLATSVKNLLALRKARTANRRVVLTRSRARTQLTTQYDLCGVVYESDAMHEVVAIACRVAKADVPVLITGPSGSGKEKIAEIVQRNSAVRDGPFVRVHLGALPAELVSAELFGAEAGAYTGANKARAGRFEAADGGTLFLDEIATLSLDGQVKLLRTLQTGQFERLGSTQTRSVKVRVIAATNVDLRQAIKAGQFREDLFYRLNVIELKVPALADRSEDVAPLARSFVDNAHRLSSGAVDALETYVWPGNVRELQNCIRRACLLATSAEITAADLGLAGAIVEPRPLEEPDKDTIERLLARHGGVVAAAARELGLSRQALYRRMEKFGIDIPQ